MPVHTFKDNPLSVQRHDPVFHLKSAESDFLRDHFLKAAFVIVNFYNKIIKPGSFRAPQPGVSDAHGYFSIRIRQTFRLPENLPISGQDCADPACAP